MHRVRSRVTHRSTKQNSVAEELSSRIRTIKTSEIEPYIDSIAVWLPDRLSEQQFEVLQAECGGIPFHIISRPSQFRRRYKLRLKLSRPTPKALDLLGRIEGAHLNYVEFALDLTFHTDDACDEARAVIDMCIIKRHHQNQKIRYVNGTRYSGPRTAPNVLVIYSDRPSKVTGESCVHIEWRISRSRELRKLNIESACDLIDFDFRAFWKKRLVLGVPDIERLGRYQNNWQNRSKRRKARIVTFGTPSFRYNSDERIGNTLWRMKPSVQLIIDHSRGKYPIRGAIRILDAAHLLPSRSKPR